MKKFLLATFFLASAACCAALATGANADLRALEVAKKIPVLTGPQKVHIIKRMEKRGYILAWTDRLEESYLDDVGVRFYLKNLSHSTNLIWNQSFLTRMAIQLKVEQANDITFLPDEFYEDIMNSIILSLDISALTELDQKYIDMLKEVWIQSGRNINFLTLPPKQKTLKETVSKLCVMQ